MRRVLLIVQLVVVPLFLRAQQVTPQAMNLEQCIHLNGWMRKKN